MLRMEIVEQLRDIQVDLSMEENPSAEVLSAGQKIEELLEQLGD
jgi:hypothetical protein